MAHPHAPGPELEPLATGRDVGPASTPSISATEASSSSLDVQELWRRTSQTTSQTESPMAGRGDKIRSRRASSITTAALFPDPQAAARRRRREYASDGPSLMAVGMFLLVGSALLGTLGLFIVALSSSMEPTGYRWIDAVAEDKHYKYLMPLQVTVLLGFVIVNWGSLKIFRHS